MAIESDGNLVSIVPSKPRHRRDVALNTAKDSLIWLA